MNPVASGHPKATWNRHVAVQHWASALSTETIITCGAGKDPCKFFNVDRFGMVWKTGNPHLIWFFPWFGIVYTCFVF